MYLQNECYRGCINGKCTAPNVCSCEPGWQMDAIGTKCIAKCDHSCLNGICSGPNQCSCNHGYVKDELDQLRFDFMK